MNNSNRENFSKTRLNTWKRARLAHNCASPLWVENAHFSHFFFVLTRFQAKNAFKCVKKRQKVDVFPIVENCNHDHKQPSRLWDKRPLVFCFMHLNTFFAWKRGKTHKKREISTHNWEQQLWARRAHLLAILCSF